MKTSIIIAILALVSCTNTAKKESEPLMSSGDTTIALTTSQGIEMEIIFAGDIDGDGALDFFIDTSTEENVSQPTLYLSKPAEEGRLLKAVARLTSVGC